MARLISGICKVVLGGVLLGGIAAAQAGGGDAKAQADAAHQLENKRLRGVTAQVQDGVATLTGSVETFRDKLDAGRKLQKLVKAGEITKVDNRVQVSGGGGVSDQTLGQKLAGKLTINNNFPDRTAFEYVGVGVQDGVVTLNGFVTQPIDKDDIEGIVGDTAGVKDLVNHIQVGPASPNDDRIRRDVFRAIYGYQTFTRYALDPAKSIRILVLNGNVTLVGVVDSQSDKDIANLRADGVGGVFKVTNNLQVAGQNEK